MMRYELSDGEWSILRVMLPNKPRGVAVWMADAFSAVSFGCCAQAPRGTISRKPMAHVCYDRFVRWQRAGIWRNITMALATLPDARMEMIDTSMVRVHQHAACITDSAGQSVGRSRGGLTSKLHALVYANGLPIRLGLTIGEAYDNQLCSVLLTGLKPQTMLLADRAYDADWIRALVNEQGAWANIPPKRNRKRSNLLQPVSLSSPQSGRAVLQQDQALPPHSHPLRQARGQLSGIRRTRVHPLMAARL